MKRMWLCLLLALVLGVPAVPARAEQAPWTVLVYLCGSDLESRAGQASEDIREILASGAGASGSVNVLAATGGSAMWQRYGISNTRVQYYNLRGDAPLLLAEAGGVSMGSADTLAAFLRYGLSNAPAGRTALILWDHGGGPVYGVCEDENHPGDALTLPELRDALNRGLNGARLDLLAFDACLMNSVDACALAAGFADYTVSSQEMVTGTGFTYDEWLAALAADSGMDPLALGELIARSYVAGIGSGRTQDTATMSVVRSDAMAGVVRAADAFAAALTPMLADRMPSVARLRNRLTSFGEFLDEDASDLVDIGALCDAFSPLLPDECAALRAAAEAAVAFNATTDDIAGQAGGLSLFMPYSTARQDRAGIADLYGNQKGDYAALVTALAAGFSGGDYAMTAAGQSAEPFYLYDGESEPTGALCSIWDGLYGDAAAQQAAQSGGGIWAGLADAPAPTAAPGGIWAGLGGATPAPTQAAPDAVLAGIWAGLTSASEEYYQSQTPNQNVQPGISEAATPDAVVAAAQDYFSASALTTQSVYTLQLTRDDLDHLAAASGALFKQEGGERVRLGDMGQSTVDWSTGLVFSMFDGAWPTLSGAPVCAERLYTQADGGVRFAIPARINGLSMYLLAVRDADGGARVLGATQGYDEDGMAIRGSIPLEAGMTVEPLYTALDGDGNRRQWTGDALTVPPEGLTLAWRPLPPGDYEYCLALTDLTGAVQYTQGVDYAVA